MTTGERRAPARRDDGREDRFWRDPLLHLSGCVAIGVLVILVILAIHWLA